MMWWCEGVSMSWQEFKKMALAGLFFSITTLVIHDVMHASEVRERCEAAQETVIEELELISEAGKFPSEKITNRCEILLGGCEP